MRSTSDVTNAARRAPHERTQAMDPLVVSRVSHCELRDLEGAAVVGPSERPGMSVVVADEGDDAIREFVAAVELAVFEEPALQDREEKLDLVEARRMRRRVVQEH